MILNYTNLFKLEIRKNLLLIKTLKQSNRFAHRDQFH